MKTKILLLGAVLILIIGLAAGTFWWQHRPQIIVLNNGDKLTLVGVGYRAQAQGDKLNLSLGFSHPVVHSMPKGVKCETPTQTEILIKGIDRQQVGQVAAEVRADRSPDCGRYCALRARIRRAGHDFGG